MAIELTNEPHNKIEETIIKLANTIFLVIIAILTASEIVINQETIPEIIIWATTYIIIFHTLRTIIKKVVPEFPQY